ncbi:MAG: MFS transporter [Desulfobacterota bacterium]|nr:MFS transporter [Thermodesulfobacteriota bacterium]
MAQIAFSSAFFSLIPTLPIYLSTSNMTEAEIGLLIGAFSLSSLVLRPFVGRALLKVEERAFMIAGAALFVLSSTAYLFAKPFWPFLIVRVIHGIGLALFATASFTLVVRITPKSKRGQGLSFFYLAINVAFALAPSLGMDLVNHFSFSILFLACAGLSMIALVISGQLKRSGSGPSEMSLRKQPLLSREALPAGIMAFMGSFIWGAVTAFFSLYALQHGVTNPGIFFAALAITLMLARSLGGKILDLYSREKVILPCILAQIVGMAVLAFSSSLPLFLLVAVIWGVGNAFYYPTLVAYSIDLAGSSRGPAIGTYMTLSDSGIGVGSLVMGIVLQATNFTVMFLCLALVGLIDLFYFYSFVKARGG